MWFKETNNTLRLAIPMILGQMSHVVLGLVDAYMVGNIGATPLAAVALSNSIFSVIMVFGLGIAYALSPLLALAASQKQYHQAATLLNNSLFINLLAGISIAGFIFFGSFGVFHLNQPLEVSTLAQPYLQVLALSFIPLMGFVTYKQFCEGLGITTPPLIAAMLSIPVNIMLNYYLIHANSGTTTFYNGYIGTAYGTLITRIAIFIGLMIFVLQKKSFQIYMPKNILPKIQKDIAYRLIKLGVPSGLQWTLEAGAFGVAAIMMGWLGTKSLAAHNIAISLATLSFIIVTALAAASAIRIGTARGEKDYQKVLNIGKNALVLGVGFMVFCAIILIIFNEKIAAEFIQDADVVHTAAQLLIIAGFFQIFDGAQAVSAGLLRGLEDVKIPTIYITITYWVLAIPLGYYLAFTCNMREKGVWYALSLGLFLVSILLVKRFFDLAKKQV
jgi:MATE family multidrug resistance protein